MIYKFLHVSDIHYRTTWPEETGVVCQKFGEDLKTHQSAGENAFVVLSGDLVFSGEHAELYKGFMNSIAKDLDAAGFSKERRICIPGNHDISQAALKPLLLMQRGTLSQIRDETTFNDSIPVMSELIFDAKFSNYKDCESDFAHFTCFRDGLGGAGWELPGGFGLYCLNTALCSSGGLKDANGKPVPDRNELMVDTRSLNKWLAETDYRSRILIMHHPLDCEVPPKEWTGAEVIFV
jgi:hypothetical protein